MIKIFLHGTTDAFLPSILKEGLRSPDQTSNRSERRKRNLDKIFLLSDLPENESQARLYAERAATKFGGNPIILKITLDSSLVQLERTGRFVQWVIDSVPPETIHAPLSCTEQEKIL